MTSNAAGGSRILGSLRSADGKGVVRMEDRFNTDIDDLWAALTDPDRLSRWLGDFEGDLRLGGEFRARFFASGWEGTGWVDLCEPPQRLSSRNAGCRWTSSLPMGPGCRSTSRTSPHISRVGSAPTRKDDGTS